MLFLFLLERHVFALTAMAHLISRQIFSKPACHVCFEIFLNLTANERCYLLAALFTVYLTDWLSCFSDFYFKAAEGMWGLLVCLWAKDMCLQFTYGMRYGRVLCYWHIQRSCESTFSSFFLHVVVHVFMLLSVQCFSQQVKLKGKYVAFTLAFCKSCFYEKWIKLLLKVNRHL